jgi:hypothetical protein
MMDASVALALYCFFVAFSHTKVCVSFDENVTGTTKGKNLMSSACIVASCENTVFKK